MGCGQSAAADDEAEALWLEDRRLDAIIATWPEDAKRRLKELAIEEYVRAFAKHEARLLEIKILREAGIR